MAYSYSGKHSKKKLLVYTRKNLKNITLSEKTLPKRVHTISPHLYEVLEQTNSEKQEVSGGWRRVGLNQLGKVKRELSSQL